ITTARTDTNVADFGLGSVLAGLVVADQAGGELRRPAALEDYFDGPVSPALWGWGTWNGTAYSPAPAGGLLPVPSATSSAWLRSNQGFTRQVLEGRVTFGAGAWQHVGFADDSFASVWAILSTASGDGRLYARTNDGDTDFLDPLPGVALGVPHDLRIVWGAAPGGSHPDR